ncbi:MAG: pyridoxal phosphate-dependent aminotransferase [Rhizobiaceae bacterium]|nr:pyridoxal phosphate-dependent aminotransferase [Rhizobiaceae bacterium]
MTAIDGLRSTGLSIPISRIRELANRHMGNNALIPLWFGEPDVPTPEFIIEPAHRAMLDGKTTYNEGLGKPWLRSAIANYMTGLYATDISINRIAVTVSGTNAVNLAFQLLMTPGDKLVTTTPSFPTLLTVPQLQQAEIDTIALKPSSNGWSVDVNALIEAASNAKILQINSPNNPTGWTLSLEDMRAILNAARKSGCWIISDEVYSRIVYDGKAAPSFAELAEPEDRVVIVNSFSKSWAMTGWRLGWLTLPPSLLPECEKLMEFSMSCAPEFVQAGGLKALENGEDFIAEQMARYRRGRDVSLERLSAMSGVTVVPPHAAFYAFFQIEGVRDDVALAEQIAKDAQVGIAPGSAFDPTLENWFRICFAKDEALLNEAFDRLEAFLKSR